LDVDQHNNCLPYHILYPLPRPQALIKKFHASHYMKGLHEVVHRDEQAQGVMGLRHRKLRSAWAKIRYYKDVTLCENYVRDFFIAAILPVSVKFVI
jgi:hypothetical protein